ncbi:hypothetical protein L4D06_23760 [Enterovibrio makurazakiensis]|uniref:toxin-antitoxin system YwqK family antitoxin n=1 Tax=Enterovibrio makurazakiensis TaxID=2910232 RepID=UPI003D1B2DA1
MFKLISVATHIFDKFSFKSKLIISLALVYSIMVGPLQASQFPFAYLDDALLPTDKASASYQHSQFERGGEGNFLVKVYYKESKQVYLSTTGQLDDTGTLVYQGDYTFSHPNGALKEKGHFDEGKRDGEVIAYRQDGTISEQSTYDKRLLTERLLFSSDGSVSRKDTYEYDPDNSDNYTHHSKIGDNIICTSYYVNGLKDGIQESEDLSLKLKMFDPYVAGERHGLVVVYINEMKRKSQYFSHGKKHGNYSKYNESGNLIYESNFHNGLVSGETNYYFDNGNLSEKRLYGERERLVSWEKYFETGQLKEKMQHDEGGNIHIKELGTLGQTVSTTFRPLDSQEWNITKDFGFGGALLQIIKSKDGQLEKHIKVFYQNGIIKSERIDDDNGRYVERRWNEDGTLTTETILPKDERKWNVRAKYYGNGALRQEIKELISERKYLLTRYSDTGELLERTQKVDDKREGIQLYNSYGTIEHTEFENDQPHGKYEKVNAKGELLEEGVYKRGQKHGLWRQIDVRFLPIPRELGIGDIELKLDHVVKRSSLEIEYQNGALHGIYRFTDQDGVQLIAGQFDAGTPIGNWMVRTSADGLVIYKNNTNKPDADGYRVEANLEKALVVQGTYLDGLRTGKWRAFTYFGELQLEGVFERGVPVGVWKRFYRYTRAVECNMNYKDGYPLGRWQHFNNEGEMVWDKYLDFRSSSSNTQNPNWSPRRDHNDIPWACNINVPNAFLLEG